MIEELKMEENHQGFLFLYDAKDHQRIMLSPHHHKELEMNIIIRGSGEYILANQWYQLNAGHIVWLFPGQEHQLSRTDANFQMYVIVFKEELFQNILLLKEKYSLLTQKNPIGSFCRKVSLSSIEKLKKVCESLSALNIQKEVMPPAYYYAGQAFGFKQNSEYLHADPVLLNAGLSYLMTIGWHLFVTEGSEEKRKTLNPSVEQAINLLRASTDKDYGLSELALECGISSSRLSRLFNKQMGVSIVDYKNKLKLDKFMDFVKNNPDFSISEACYSAGFGSYPQFYKIFRQSFGISPKTYFSKNSTSAV